MTAEHTLQLTLFYVEYKIPLFELTCIKKKTNLIYLKMEELEMRMKATKVETSTISYLSTNTNLSTFVSL